MSAEDSTSRVIWQPEAITESDRRDEPAVLGSPRSASNLTHPGMPAIIAFVHTGADWIRGSEQCLLDLASRLDLTRFRPLVVCNAPTLRKAAEALGIQTVQVDLAGFGPVAAAPVRRLAYDVLREHGVALVHANVLDTVAALVPAVRRLRIPLVSHLHLPFSSVQIDRLWSLAHQATAAVGVADHVVAPLRADGMPSRRVRVILNAVDHARLSRGDATGLRAALGIPAEAFVVGSVGSLIIRKGLDVTIRSIARARAHGLDAHFLICGDGEADASLRTLARELNVAAAVHFLGMRSDAGAVLRDAADVCVSSAREEALPLNVLEAQWLGVPVIVSDIPAHHEALVPNVTGIMVPVEAPDALADTLVHLAADPGQRQMLADAGQAHARTRFSMERYVSEFEALYDELLARPASAYGWLRGSAWPSAYTPWLASFVKRRLTRQPRTPLGRDSVSVPAVPTRADR